MANTKKVFRDVVIQTGSDVHADLTDFIRALSRGMFTKIHTDGPDGMCFTIPVFIGDADAVVVALKKQGFDAMVSDKATIIEIEQEDEHVQEVEAEG